MDVPTARRPDVRAAARGLVHRDALGVDDVPPLRVDAQAVSARVLQHGEAVVVQREVGADVVAHRVVDVVHLVVARQARLDGVGDGGVRVIWRSAAARPVDLPWHDGRVAGERELGVLGCPVQHADDVL